MKKVTVKSVSIPGSRPAKTKDVTIYLPAVMNIFVTRETPNWMRIKEECDKLHKGDRLYLDIDPKSRVPDQIPVRSEQNKIAGRFDFYGFCSDICVWEYDNMPSPEDRDARTVLFQAIKNIRDYLSVRVLTENDPKNHYVSYTAVLSLKEGIGIPEEIASVEDVKDTSFGKETDKLQELFENYEKTIPSGISDESLKAAENAPAKTRKPAALSYEKLTEADAIVPGTRLRFGSEKTPWVVLEVLDDRMLVISDDCVCVHEWNKGDNCSWEVSSLRRFLNDTYYNEKFSEAEKQKILLTHHVNPGNSKNTVPGGNDTEDYLFVLTSDEVNELMPDKPSRERTRFWWVRNPGATRGDHCFVGANGTIFSKGWLGAPRGVRPCMWMLLP